MYDDPTKKHCVFIDRLTACMAWLAWLAWLAAPASLALGADVGQDTGSLWGALPARSAAVARGPPQVFSLCVYGRPALVVRVASAHPDAFLEQRRAPIASAGLIRGCKTFKHISRMRKAGWQTKHDVQRDGPYLFGGVF